MSLTTGTRIASYEIVAILGAGGMGEVYRARDTRLERDVAIKVLAPALAADPAHVERFRREARAVAALSHPNIVTIHSVEEVEGLQFLTMELVEGRTLDNDLPAGGYALSRLLDVAIPLADALSAAHERGIVHRDLKPANVMIDGYGRIKVLDFGLAKDVAHETFAADETRAALTNAGVVVGTTAYMAPEQIEGQPVDARTDIFALGIVLYELATGTRPFAGNSSAALMTAILRDPPPAIEGRRSDLPLAVPRIVVRCLEKQPNDRIQTARDVCNELRTVQRDVMASGSRVTGQSALHDVAVERSAHAEGLWTAVVPFTSRSGDADGQALAEGLTDDIEAGLDKFPYLKVAARATAARFVIEGSVRRAGSAVRVSVELKDLQAGMHLWGDKFDREVSGATLFAVQDDIAARVIATVGDSNGVLIRTMAATVRDRPADSLPLDALIWRSLIGSHRQDPHENAGLIAAFNAALTREPSHAEAWGCLAFLYGRAYLNPATGIADAVTLQRAAAQRAIDLDPGNQDGWCELATAAFFDRDEAGFRAAVDRAIALNPLNTNVVAFLAHLIAYAGEWSRGLEILDRVMALGAQHPGWYHFMPFVNHFRLGEFEQAWQVIKRVNMAEYPFTLVGTAMTAARLERWDDVRATIATIRRSTPLFLDVDSVRAAVSKLSWDEALIERQVTAYAEALRSVEDGSPATGARRPPSGAGGARPSIAVLPFANLSGDPENEYFGDGLAEDILDALHGVPGLKVIARTSSFAFKGKSGDVRRIAETLHVGSVLEGSVRRSAGRVRVNAQLVDASTGAHLWSHRYDRNLTDIFAVQDDIAHAIVDTLKITLASGAAPARTPAKIDAYDAHLRGRHHLVLLTPDDVDAAQRYFEQAIAIDPSYAPAHADLAGCHVLYVEQGRSPAGEGMPRARDLARRAVQLDPAGPDGHHWLARVAAEYDLDWPTAEHHYEIAMASGRLRPAAAAALAQWVLLPLGRLDEAVEVCESAVAADPLAPTRIHLAMAFRARGEFERAIAIVDGLPDGHFKFMSRGLAYVAMERYDEAIEALERALLAPTPIYAIGLAILAGAHARNHDHDKAREILARLDDPKHALLRSVAHAAYHLAVREGERASGYLLEAIAERNPWPGTMVAGLRTAAEFLSTPYGRRVLEALNLTAFRRS
jgi:non-specific serine/threonine protein kinase